MNKNDIIRSDKFYKRNEVKKDIENLYIFTDNIDRNSGKGNIDNDSEYCQYYNVKNVHYPSVTSAVIRGLDNACPITTQHYYNSDYKGINGRWNDKDIDEFKNVIDKDFNFIKLKYANGKYKKIIFPYGGIFNSKISNISKERCPLLYEYLMEKCMELYQI